MGAVTPSGGSVGRGTCLDSEVSPDMLAYGPYVESRGCARTSRPATRRIAPTTPDGKSFRRLVAMADRRQYIDRDRVRRCGNCRHQRRAHDEDAAVDGC